MSEKKAKKIKEDDPKQSEAFRKAVSDLEVAGELNLTDQDAILSGVIKKTKTDNRP